MIDWISCLRAVKCDFQNEGQGGTGEYEDPKYGTQDFQWDANKKRILITWFDTEPFCICGNGIGSMDCDCEWDWFMESEPIRKTFTKAQYKKLTAPNLFNEL